MAKCMHPMKSGILPILLICGQLAHISKMGENVFSENRFQNCKKDIDKFTTHEGSLSHTEAKVKWMAKGRLTKSVMFTNFASSKDKKSRFSVSIEGSTISCSPGNCISRPH